MPQESILPSAAPIRAQRAARPRRTMRVAAVGALVAGIAASGAVMAFAQPSLRTDVTAAATIVDQDDLPIQLTIGQDAISGAESALSKAETAVKGATSGVDTDELDAYVEELKDYEDMPRTDVVGLTADASTETRAVIAQTAQLREEKAAEKRREKEERKRQKEAERKAAEEAKKAQTPEGAKLAAREIAADEFGWGDDQFGCLSNLWTKESGWNYQASNASSHAYGIPQALPGSKMTSISDDWQTNPLTQIRWGLTYIQGSYGTPCAAWGHSQAMNWY